MEGQTIRLVEYEAPVPGADLADKLSFEGRPPAFVVGFVSPHADFDAAVRAVRAVLPRPVPLMLATTAGELGAQGGPLYRPTPARWQRLLFLAFSPDLLRGVVVHAVPLHNRDLRAGSPDVDPAQRVAAIAAELKTLKVPFAVDSRDTLAYTLIDGVSLAENAFMEAVYLSGRLPCLMIGGSAGGLLDFRTTRLSDGDRVLENHALVTLMKVDPAYRFGVFRSQNFEKAGGSVVVLGGRTALREVSHVLDEDALDKVPAAEGVARLLRCTPAEIGARLADFAFGVEIGGQMYIRSVASVDPATGVLRFYCDIDVGDRLHLMRKTSFAETTRDDWARYLKGKPQPVGGLFNDCILRRANNGRNLGDITCFQSLPAAGFSTFGELLGVNVNETLTAVFFHQVAPGADFHCPYVDDFTVRYAAFQASFLERRMNRDAILHAVHRRIVSQVIDGQAMVAEMTRMYEAIQNDLDRSSGDLQTVLSALADFTGAIEENTEAYSHIYEQVRALSDNLRSINSISETVNDIAEQTGVLSINASIQAARAGDAGRAFAVVAGEVRKLSVQTQGHVQAITGTADAIVGSVGSILEGAEKASRLLGTMVSSNAEVHYRAEEVAGQVRRTVEKMESGRRTAEGIRRYLDAVRHTQELVGFISQ